MATDFGAPFHLRTENLENPVGLDIARPRFSWWIHDRRQGARQSARQVQLATSSAKLQSQPDVWDSGPVESPQSHLLFYAGPALQPRTRYHWRVRSWDADGLQSDWSEPASFETGLLGSVAWSGEWISLPPDNPEESGPAPYLRKGFSVSKELARARLYATAKGLFEFHLNGQRIGDDRLTPGWTDFNKRHQYLTYDVTGQVVSGDNAIGAILGDGWYAGYLMFQEGARGHWGPYPQLRAMLILDYADGSSETIATDRTWTGRFGDILSSDLYNGEQVDARQSLGDWATATASGDGFSDVTVEPDDGVAIVAKPMPPVRALEEISPTSVETWKPGVHIYDFGTNLAGVVRLRLKAEAGTTVTLRHGELREEDGALHTANLRRARCTDTYVCRGDPAGETFEPRFTFHGFQYLEITGLDEAPPAEDVTAVVLYSEMEPAGEFSCGHDLANQLQRNIIRSQKGNYLEIPTDCPQRDERLGWTGDAQVFAPAAARNFQVGPFLGKYLDDLRDSQLDNGDIPAVAPRASSKTGVVTGGGGPAWADAICIIPWVLFRRYGDKRVLQDNFDAMCRYIDFLREDSDDLIHPSARHHWQGFGDWLGLDGPGKPPWRTATPRDLIGTAYFCESARCAGRAARALGRNDEASELLNLARQVRDAFQREFVTATGRVTGDSQTAYLLALGFDLLPGDVRNHAVERLLIKLREYDNHLCTGFVGTPLLLPTLTRIGKTELAYDLFLQESYPGWLYSVVNGATSIWERWNAYTREGGIHEAGMNSYNHYAYGAVCDWMFATIGGIDQAADSVGFSKLRLAPVPDARIGHARCSQDTAYGTVTTRWQLNDDRFQFEFCVPPNSVAEVRVPAIDLIGTTLNGKPLQESPEARQPFRETGAVSFHVDPGTYAVETQIGDIEED